MLICMKVLVAEAHWDCWSRRQADPQVVEGAKEQEADRQRYPPDWLQDDRQAGGWLRAH